MFIRKLYYDLTTGAVVELHMRQGAVMMTTFEEDCAACPSLAGRTEADTGCMVWTQPDEAVEALLQSAAAVHVDVTKTPHALTVLDAEAEQEAANAEEHE